MALTPTIWGILCPSMREKAQPHNLLGHYQKREPFPQSRWSKNDQDHMKDHR